MPFFEYKCSCGSEGIALGPLVQSPFAGVAIIATPSYFDRQLGVTITGPKQRREMEKAAGVVDTGDYQHLDDIPLGKPPPAVTDEEFERAWHEEVITKQVTHDE